MIASLTKGIYWNKAAPLCLEPPAPIRRFQIADIGDRCPAEIGRRRKAPAHHGKLTLAARRSMNHRRHAIGVDGGKRRKIAGPVAHDPERPPYGFLTAGNAVEIAHGVERRSLPL